MRPNGFFVPHPKENNDLDQSRHGLVGDGPKGSIVRKVAVDKTRSSLEKSLVAIKAQLEQ